MLVRLNAAIGIFCAGQQCILTGLLRRDPNKFPTSPGIPLNRIYDISPKRVRAVQGLSIGGDGGLRRREIDTLERSAFWWDRRMIRIESTKWFHPKSEDSIGDVEIDPELVEVFRLTFLPPNQAPIVKKIRDRKTRNCPEVQAAAAADRRPMKSRILGLTILLSMPANPLRRAIARAATPVPHPRSSMVGAASILMASRYSVNMA